MRGRRKLAAELRAHVTAGESLPAALARYPRAFSSLYRGLVAAGAETGRLAEVLARLADYLEAREALRQKVGARADLSDGRHGDRVRGDRRADGLRGAAGGVGLPAEPADAAVAHAGVDRDQRLFSRDRMVGRRASRVGRVRGFRSRCGAARSARAGTRCCCGCRWRPAVAQPRHGALREHAGDPGGSGAPLLRSLDAAAEVVRMLPLRSRDRHCGRTGARRRRAVARIARAECLSAGARPPGGQRRAKRTAGADARACSAKSWSATRSAVSRGSPRCCSRR